MKLTRKWRIIVVVFVVLAIGGTIRNHLFQKQIKKETKNFLQEISDQSSIPIGQNQLKQLPLPVKKWLNLTRCLDQEPISSMFISQVGVLRTKPDGKWMPFEAVQYSGIDRPSFIWKSEIEAIQGVTIYGRDLYMNQEADMLIKLIGIFTIGSGSGPELVQGSLVRYLAEIVWYPRVALSPYITWDVIDDHSAKATIIYGDVSASGIFYFKDNGEPERFVAQRYMENGGEYSLEEWSVYMDQYKEVQGILIPTHGDIYWNLIDGKFHWLQFEVTDARFKISK
ncbi:hypothetical protein GC105_06630 [Alkalibaculum sp. M08DMB]|uniref:Uncharacterized protein n=1 Tax=Alkalibaculum sporogenes TaxID=2655001 RepID=A0A6A7K7H7_9FIRM|nr:DUF6544 family protein [Alkalibaculum sporogenes]MPW25459.1 hypothetical protein [Alkalibaculum sporogenes]